MQPLLQLDGVQKHFKIHAGGTFRRQYKWCRAVDGVSFEVWPAQCFGIAGESGSGKTTLVNLILLEEKLTAGSITFQGKDVSRLAGENLRWYRRSIQSVFQDAGRSLSPRMRIEDIVGEPLLVHATGKADRKAIRG